jgi:hypothetical protein
MYGPHYFVFASGIWQGPNITFPPHCFYNTLSPWVDTLQKEFRGLSLASKQVPYPVDIDKFSPSSLPKKYDCFLYCKGRKRDLYVYAHSRLQAMGFNCIVVEYGKYTEEEYINILQQSRFGVWVGCHESQGFGLEEALSSNIPLAVWNVKSMFDEYNHLNEQGYKEDPAQYKLTATSVSYWDACCGELFYEKEEFDTTVQKVSTNSKQYTPRDFIEKTLSPKACYQRLLSVLEEIPAQNY